MEQLVQMLNPVTITLLCSVVTQRVKGYVKDAVSDPVNDLICGLLVPIGTGLTLGFFRRPSLDGAIEGAVYGFMASELYAALKDIKTAPVAKN